jgi:D-glucosaminate-6-phosphate ammonia-lyase
MPGGNVYERLGVRKIINAASWRTNVGGSMMPPPVRQAMDEAAQWFVDLGELNARAGEVIAKFTGAEAGLVTAGSAAGMLLEAAASMTGTDQARIDRLPDSRGMKDEIVIHRFQRVTYDRCFRAAGATLVEIGDSGGTEEWELENAINENTAAVAYIIAARQSGAIPLQRTVEIAHAHGVPVIVDAAAMLPPPENLTRYVDMGADLVSFSGGKGVLGPQSTGILCGSAEMIQAASMNGAPNQGVGRTAKVCKEEIAGLVTALELFVDTDHDAAFARWESMAENMATQIGKIPGLDAQYFPATPGLDEFESATPRVYIFAEVDSKVNLADVDERLKLGDPPVYTYPAEHGRGIALSPVNLVEGEDEMVVQRFNEVMSAT